MSASRWLMRFVPRPDARLRLVCLAHAGGNAVFYRPWAHALAPAVDVVAVQLPGRLDRVAERPETDLLTAVGAIGAAIRADGGGPVALFGHSMGALLAYELARRLPAGGNPVHHLMVSGHGDPRRAARQRLHQAPAAQLWQHVISSTAPTRRWWRIRIFGIWCCPSCAPITSWWRSTPGIPRRSCPARSPRSPARRIRR